ncbi:MAG: DUF1415 domain-containing protein [Gammaproteobacteria bacterium]
MEHVKRWLDRLVIDHELCPFARRERARDSIRFVLCDATDEAMLLDTLEAELNGLTEQENVETSLIVHPHVLGNFSDYNQFLNKADDLLDILGLAGTLQIASFHPDYQFADTSPEDASNYTNRSPYPLLHILRESSVQRAVEQHPDVDAIPDANIAKLEALGTERIQTLLKAIEKDEAL